ncbi:hypothetical protein FVD39_13590 [Bacillus amyloliquefaciens]|nr:hypothetical protein FVD39_13590 [Bacillus amyloliquefaciens]
MVEEKRQTQVCLFFVSIRDGKAQHMMASVGIQYCRGDNMSSSRNQYMILKQKPYKSNCSYQRFSISFPTTS